MSENVAELTLRPFEERDFYPIVNLIAQTWLADFPGRPGELAGEEFSRLAALWIEKEEGE